MNENLKVISCREVTLLDDLSIHTFQCYGTFSKCWLRNDLFFVITWMTPPSVLVGLNGTVLTGDLWFELPHYDLRVLLKGEAKAMISYQSVLSHGCKMKQDFTHSKWVDGTEAVTVLQYFPPTAEQPEQVSVLVAVSRGLRVLEDS